MGLYSRYACNEGKIRNTYIITINVLLFLQVRDIFFFMPEKHLINGGFLGVFEELETFLAPENGPE